MTRLLDPESDSYRVKVLRHSAFHTGAEIVHLGISIDNPKHRGSKLDALLAWAVARFARVQINLHDSLQRHNIAFLRGCDPEAVRSEALHLGEAWITENAPVLTGHPQARLIRRDELIHSVPHQERWRSLETLYAADPTFRSLVDRDIDLVVSRKHTQAAGWDEARHARFVASSRGYILDELALMSLLNERERFVEAYPGRFLTLLHDPRRLSVHDLPAGLRHYPMIEVDFVRRKGQPLAAELAA